MRSEHKQTLCAGEYPEDAAAPAKKERADHVQYVGGRLRGDDPSQLIITCLATLFLRFEKQPDRCFSVKAVRRKESLTEQFVWINRSLPHALSGSGTGRNLPAQGTLPKCAVSRVKYSQPQTGDLFLRRGPRAQSLCTLRGCASPGSTGPQRQPIASTYGCAHSRLKIPLACSYLPEGEKTCPRTPWTPERP